MSPFGQLFWGFLIVFIDFRINGFDILIDLVGYIFIVIGLGELAKRNAHFEQARPFAIVLLVLSVFDLVTRTPTGEGTTTNVGLFGSVGLAIVFTLVLLVINLLLVYNICEGIAEMAGPSELATLARQRWQFFLWTAIAAQVFLAITFASSRVNVILALAIIVAGLTAAILLAGLLRRADKAFPRGV